MRTAMLVGTGVVVSLAIGCRSKEPAYSANDRVHVDVPFVDVRVGDEGGVKVNAPFTNVETPRYTQGQMAAQGVVQQPVYAPPAQSPPVYQQQAPGVYQQAPPANSTQYQPLTPGAYDPGP